MLNIFVELLFLLNIIVEPLFLNNKVALPSFSPAPTCKLISLIRYFLKNGYLLGNGSIFIPFQPLS